MSWQHLGHLFAVCRVVQGYVWFQILFIYKLVISSDVYLVSSIDSALCLCKQKLASLGVPCEGVQAIPQELGEKRAPGIQISENFPERINQAAQRN